MVPPAFVSYRAGCGILALLTSVVLASLRATETAPPRHPFSQLVNGCEWLSGALLRRFAPNSPVALTPAPEAGSGRV